MSGAEGLAAAGPGGPVESGCERRLSEAEALWWRETTSERTLRRAGRRWTALTLAVSMPFFAAGGLLIWLEPLTFPAALWAFAHGWGIPMLYARRGARAVVPIGAERGPRRSRGGGADDADPGADRVALGLLGDLVDHRSRELLAETGLALERGELGAWLVGERGAILVRPGGRRVDCFCVRIAEPDGLPGGDLVAHLLLALREDERDFATVANHDFSGAPCRVRPRLPKRSRPALDAAVRLAREGDSGAPSAD